MPSNYSGKPTWSFVRPTGVYLLFIYKFLPLMSLKLPDRKKSEGTTKGNKKLSVI